MRGIRVTGAALTASLWAVLAVTAVTAVTAGTLVLPAGGAAAESTTLPGSLSTEAGQTGPLTLVVAPGTTPVSATGVLSMPSVVEGATVTVLVNGRAALTVPARLYQQVVVPLLPTDVVAGGVVDGTDAATIGLSLRYDAPVGSSGCEPVPALTLRRLGLDYTGVETPPTSVADFFPVSAARVDVTIPRDSGDDVVQAALSAVAALSHRYPADTPVTLRADDAVAPTPAAGQRVVAIAPADAPATAAVDVTGPVPTLRLTGSGQSLTDAAAALGSDELGLAGGTSADALAAQPGTDDARGPVRTLDQLRATSPAQPADAVGTVTVPLLQDAFGTAVSSYAVHLEGTHSAVPDTAAARLDVFVDDQLVGSAVAGADPAVDVDLVVPGSMLHAADELRVTLSSATDATAACSAGLPLELALDGAASTVTATPLDPSTDQGGSAGFQLLPQELGGRLPVAVRQQGAERLDAVVDAAALVGSLQRVAAAPLQVELVQPDLLVRGTGPGLLVGADTADGTALGLPLPYAGTRLLGASTSRFRVSSDAPLAALQTVAQGGRRLLVLGSWAPGDVAAPAGYGHRVTAFVTDTGWSGLDGDVLVLSDGGPFTVDSGTRPDPAAADTDDARATSSSYVVWFALAIAALLALLVVQTVVRARRRRTAPGRSGAQDPDLDPDVDPDVDGDTDSDGDEPADWWEDDELAGGDWPEHPDASADVSASLSRGRQPRVDLTRGRPPRP